MIRPAFYSTPQLNLIDQIREDKHIGRFYSEIKGRQNYLCKYDPIATCDIGLCYRVKDFPCKKIEECEYWKAKVRALNSPCALMSFAYLILEGYTEGTSPYAFGSRKLLILDESHSIDKYLISHFALIVSPYTLPKDVYDAAARYIKEFKDVQDVKDFINIVSEVIATKKYDYDIMTLDGKRLTIEQAYNKKKAEDFLARAEKFLETCDHSEWIWDLKFTTTKEGIKKKLIISPLYARYIAKDLLWKKARYYIISSATILDANRFVAETGLDYAVDFDEIVHIKVPSTFPPENRPIVDTVNGKLVYTERDKNLPYAIEILEKILDEEEGVNVAVHTHSYEMALAIQNMLHPKYKRRLITHTPKDRDAALRKFRSSRGKVFISVAFEEGYDWVGDICEAQVLFKVPFGDIKDRRVARRLEKKEWSWYYLEALKTVIQAYGRAVRSPEDKARFYVIDKSFVDLIRKTRRCVPEWFKESLPAHWAKIVR